MSFETNREGQENVSKLTSLTLLCLTSLTSRWVSRQSVPGLSEGQAKVTATLKQAHYEGGTMLIGYARVSISGESLDLQIEALSGAGVDRDRIFVEVDEKGSGAKAEHPQREQAESLLCEGDTLVVWRLDRLDLNVRDLIKMIEGLGRHGVGFRSLKENIDTTSGTDKPLSHLFAALAQCERALAVERSAAGRAAAKDRGQAGGRKLKLDEEKRAQANALYQDSPHSIADICRKFGISRPTLYRYLD